jgi:hypothetical protein
MPKRARPAPAPRTEPPPEPHGSDDNDNDDDEAPEAVSNSSGRESANRQRRAEEMGRQAVNKRAKAKRRHQNEQLVAQAQKRKERAAGPGSALLSEEVLEELEKKEKEEEQRKGGEGAQTAEDIMGSLDELGGQASELDGFFHGALGNNCGLGPAAAGGDGGGGNDAKKRKEWEKMLAAAIDEEQAGFSSDDDGSGGGDDSGSVGVRPVVLARPAANDLGVLPGRGVRSAAPTTAANWRKQMMYGGRHQRKSGLLLGARKIHGPAPRF